jgi:hypothetical protein
MLGYPLPLPLRRDFVAYRHWTTRVALLDPWCLSS